jgi:hypothetical protein
VVGFSELSSTYKDGIADKIAARQYVPVDLDNLSISSIQDHTVYNFIHSADLAVSLIDSSSLRSQFLIGAIESAFVPNISLAADSSYSFHPQVPREYQARIVVPSDIQTTSSEVEKEIAIYEQDLLDLEDQEEVERYTSLLLELPSTRDGHYDPGVRQLFVNEVVMNKYVNKGQAGAFGENAQAREFTLVQKWDRVSKQIDLTELAEQLAKLRAELKKTAGDTEHDVAIGALASAESAAKQGKGADTLDALSRTGKWVLGVATKIGVPLAVAALKVSLGLPAS